MKKILTILLGIALILPLYSQEADNFENETEDDMDMTDGEEPEVQFSVPEKKKFDFTRQHFEMGSGIGGGIDNGIAGTSELFTKDKVIKIDMSEIAHKVPNEGAGFNFGLNAGFYLDVMNIRIGNGLWNFGFTSSVDGSIKFNISKSLFKLIAEGNAKKHNNSGKMGASGGIYTEMGLTSSAKYQVAGKTLRAGIKPAIFTPAIYIPSSTGIYYNLYTEKETEDGKKDGLFLDTRGEISIYTPTSFEKAEPGRFIGGANGFDISLEGEYALFPSLVISDHDIGGLDIGGSFSHIPFAPAVLTSEMKMGLKPFHIELVGEDLLAGNQPKTPEFEFEDMKYNNNAKKQVFRPFRFDVYARYKPLKTEFVVIRPNIGFSVNGNKGDEEGYFNAGLEARLNLRNIFIFYLGSGYQETIWKQKMGLVLNLRAFELDLEVALRDQTFPGCFTGHGLNLFLGSRIGW
jgi:hypothetical protein